MDWNRFGWSLLVIFLSVIIILTFGFAIWNFGGEKLAFRLGIGEPVKIQGYSSYQWRGQEDYIKHKVEELIIISRDLRIFDENILPIKLNVRSLYRIKAIAGAHRSRFTSYIVFDIQYLMITDRIDLEGTVVHEFSHLLDWEYGHGLEWQKNCHKLFYKIIAKKRELVGFNPWESRPYPCTE